jgi:hydroxymethylglutaryl-CoA reductase
MTEAMGMNSVSYHSEKMQNTIRHRVQSRQRLDVPSFYPIFFQEKDKQQKYNNSCKKNI